MPVSGNDFLEFARSIPSDCEINNRNAGSRSYYAVYHQCLKKYPMNKAVGGNGGVHEKLIQSLVQSGIKSEKSIGYQLAQCRAIRVQADYAIISNFNKSDRDTAIQYADRIFASLI